MNKGFFHSLIAGIAIGAAALAFAPGAAEAHPAAPKCSTAKLIVPWKAGGGTHVIFSIFEKIIKKLDVKSKIKVVTIPGQGGNKGAKEAAKSKSDGCTLFAIHQSAITSYLNGRIKITFPAFETVALLTSTPDIIGASGQAPWNSLKELEKAAKAAPGTILTGATFGSTSQFMWLILEDLTGMKFKYVPFDGTRQRMTALLSNAIQLGTLNVASGRKYLEGGDLKGYAIAAEKRSKHLPNLPTLKELGIDYERFPVIVRYDGPGAEEGRKMMAEVPGAEMYGAETTLEDICKRIVDLAYGFVDPRVRMQ